MTEDEDNPSDYGRLGFHELLEQSTITLKEKKIKKPLLRYPERYCIICGLATRDGLYPVFINKVWRHVECMKEKKEYEKEPKTDV